MKSDQDLIGEVVGGRVEAFDELMKRYERLVYKVAWSFVPEREACLDISQCVFLKAFRSIASFRGESNLKTWLLRITYNESINHLRQHGSKSEIHEDIDERAAILGSAATQEAALVEREKQAAVERAMKKLNERYRLAVVLRYFQGLPIAEISSVLGCSEGVTKNILFRSVKSLRETLAQAG